MHGYINTRSWKKLCGPNLITKSEIKTIVNSNVMIRERLLTCNKEELYSSRKF